MYIIVHRNDNNQFVKLATISYLLYNTLFMFCSRGVMLSLNVVRVMLSLNVVHVRQYLYGY